MSIGVALLLVYTPLSVIYALGAFKNEIVSLKISLFDAVANLASKLSGLLEVLLFILWHRRWRIYGLFAKRSS